MQEYGQKERCWLRKIFSSCKRQGNRKSMGQKKTNQNADIPLLLFHHPIVHIEQARPGLRISELDPVFCMSGRDPYAWTITCCLGEDTLIAKLNAKQNGKSHWDSELEFSI